MTDLILNRGNSARRPVNYWFWVALAAVLILIVVGFLQLTKRPAASAKGAEQGLTRTDGDKPKAETTRAVPPIAPAARTSAPPALAPVPPPPSRPAVPLSPPPPARPTVSAAPAPAATAASAAAAAGSLAEAERLKAEDQCQPAREKLLKLLDEPLDAATRERAEALAGDVGMMLVTSPREMPEKTEYTVQSGDSLDRIAKKFGTTVQLVMKGNNLSRSTIRVNERLRVFSGRFAAKVDKSDNTLLLSLNDRFFKRYRVGTGQYNRTPVGAFKITDRIAQPTWWKPDGKAIPFGDPDNLLGTHWLAIDVPGYGLHGTWETNTIGRQSSAGCIRLLNPDIEELFILLPVGTPVAIED